MIIDFHTHCFPDALAPRALSSLEHNAEQTQMRPFTDGTAEGTKKLIAAHGINRAVVCNIATNAHQQPKVNNFAISLGIKSCSTTSCEDPSIRAGSTLNFPPTSGYGTFENSI